jgi:hypothetical protein
VPAFAYGAGAEDGLRWQQEEDLGDRVVVEQMSSRQRHAAVCV